MKKIFLLVLTIFSLNIVYCTFALEVDDKYTLVSEQETDSGTELIVPDDINWTQRFILTELKELRTELERTRRELNTELNNRELAVVDRALAYSGNTVNFLWLIITMAVTGFGLVGWRTMRDVRENLTTNFEAEVQKRVVTEQKKLEEFLKRFEQDHLQQSEDILKNQEFIQKKQEAGYFWSQYNREENLSSKLELLEKIGNIGLEDDELFILIERSGIYRELALWDKVLELTEKGLEISPDNTTLLYNRASAFASLENNDEALKVLSNIIGVNPAMREEIFEDILFSDIHADLEEYISHQENLNG